ncbi:unnamed protein product [Cuscuta campestris]|uniref:TF-B3 domain-containing protein n=1 Tax=Cuscuta campestris TaxID=132261 RepID=A0A484NF73_9ASTE|nr:unnamed protein product [Cuscuta campestris]
MEGVTSGMTALVGPSGNKWHVGLSQLDGDLFFHDGWEVFVKDHCLECGDNLVFRYDGNFCFQVQVFDEGLCEKELAFSADCSQDVTNFNNHHEINKRDREGLSIPDYIPGGFPKRMRNNRIHSECTSSGQENLIGKEECPSGELVCYKEIEMDGNPLENLVTVAVPFQGPQDTDASFGCWAHDEDVLFSTQEADAVAKSFTSCFPNFTKAMKGFNVSGSYTLNLPYHFATKHLPKCKVKIVLRNLKGQSWIVNSIPRFPTTRVETSHTFCGGWLGFVRDNNLGLGDICIFELVLKCEFRVRILRVEKEGTEGYTNNPIKFVAKEKGKPSILKKYKSHSQVRASIRHSVQKGTGSQDKLCSFTKGCMSLKSAPEEKIAAKSFTSSFPHFLRVMKKFNVSGSYTLKVPSQFSKEHLPSCRTEIVLHNLKGQRWSVNSIPTTRVQTLHTFCGGWMAFVRDNDIRLGDICIFELVGKCEMRVHICTIGKKGLDYRNVGALESVY